jgi:hypothetical protein
VIDHNSARSLITLTISPWRDICEAGPVFEHGVYRMKQLDGDNDQLSFLKSRPPRLSCGLPD